MTPAQLYRRSVVLPMDSLAVVRLEAGDVAPEMRIEQLKIANEQFRDLFDLLNDIKRVTGIDLDDHDTATADAQQLQSLEKFLKTRPKTRDVTHEAFVKQLAPLVKKAIDLRVPLFFVL